MRRIFSPRKPADAYRVGGAPTAEQYAARHLRNRWSTLNLIDRGSTSAGLFVMGFGTGLGLALVGLAFVFAFVLGGR